MGRPGPSVANGSGSVLKPPSRLLVFAPTRRAATETFVRANLRGLPFAITAVFGDERPLRHPLRLAYGLAVLVSKALTRVGWLRLAGLPASLVALLWIRRCRPQLLLAEFGFHAVRVMQAAAWSGLPLVVHFRGSDTSSVAKFQRLLPAYKRLLPRCAAVIVKSEPMRHTLLELGVPSDRILISPSGADAGRFHGADPAAAPPLFLTVGRFVAKKGPLHTIRAFARMRERWPETRSAELLMVGNGPLLGKSQTLTRELGLDHFIRFIGVQSPDQIAELMRGARAFLQHSLVAPDGDSEGSPVAVMEAQLSGLPVVATRHAGIPEVVLDCRTGLLVEEGDVEAMAEAMQQLVVDPSRAARLGAAGRQRIETAFTVDHHLAAVSALLNRVASTRGVME